MERLVFLGNNSFDTLRSVLLKFNAEKIFLIRGKNSYDISGARKYIESALTGLDRTVYEFFEFRENPKIEDVEKGLKYLSEYSADILVAIGGGSVLDMGKLIRFLYSYKGSITDNQFAKQRELLPFVALPTTAGTGSEATHFAVVYQNKVKYSVAHEAMLPNVSIINPVFTYNNPKYLAACTGFDALAQAIEAYWSVNATEESDRYAIKAIKLLWKDLPVAVNQKIQESMDRVSAGSYWAGRAINIAKTTAPHAVSYAFTTYYDIPHGNAVALTFPFFMKFNTSLDEQNYRGGIPFKKYQENIHKLFSLMEIDGTKLIETMQNYIKSIGLLVSINFNRELIVKNINVERMSNNPGYLSVDDIYMALNAVQIIQ
jgi:alcohol dehydrogenase class IV